MNGKHGHYGGGQRQQETVKGGGRSFEKPNANDKSQRCQERCGKPCHSEASNDRLAGYRKPLAKEFANGALERIGFSQIAAGKR